jgi:hypothetical protein
VKKLWFIAAPDFSGSDPLCQLETKSKFEIKLLGFSPRFAKTQASSVFLWDTLQRFFSEAIGARRTTDPYSRLVLPLLN